MAEKKKKEDSIPESIEKPSERMTIREFIEERNGMIKYYVEKILEKRKRKRQSLKTLLKE